MDPYLGLHPDLFEIEGRGAYINNNPGASMLAAIPYAVARPFISGLLELKPELARPKPPSTYDDPRPNRTTFFNEARARGLDVKLGLAAVAMHLGLMVPLAGLAAVVVFRFLGARLGDERQALWLALLYAFGTPIFFRSAFLNQNALVAHAVLFGFVTLAEPPPGARGSPRRGGLTVLGGMLLGVGILCDYSAAPVVLAFGLWVLLRAWRDGGAKGGIEEALRFSAGAAVPIAILFLYQYLAFGNPFLPAQTYMPDTELSVRGWHGFTWPTIRLLAGNMLDPRYGLLAFCPMLAAAIAAPWLRRRPGLLARDELALVFGATLGLWLFSSAVQFAALQWNTGVRYMIPAVPLLFLALVPVLLRLPGWARWALVIPTVAISWSVAMVREDVPTSLLHVFFRGFELPWLTVLQKTAGAYLPFLEQGADPIAIFVLTGVVIWLVWQRNSVSGER